MTNSDISSEILVQIVFKTMKIISNQGNNSFDLEQQEITDQCPHAKSIIKDVKELRSVKTSLVPLCKQ